VTATDCADPEREYVSRSPESRSGGAEVCLEDFDSKFSAAAYANLSKID
jgi:hypothetical protein